MTETSTRSSTAISDRLMKARFLVALFVAGPSLALVTLALPHAADMNELGIAASALGAYLVAGTVHLGRRRCPDWGFELAAACGTLLISSAVYFAGSSTITYGFFYIWVILYSAYFFERSRAALQLGFVGAVYATVLAFKPDLAGRQEAWVIALGTLAMSGALFVVARDRVDSLVERLAEAADTDSLTGLLNRRGFGKQFELELERAERSGESFGLIVGDLDHFKQINDRFGHQVGDEVLECVAELVRTHARRIDTVARVGGEEFAILLPSTDSQGAYVFAERLRFRVCEALDERGCRLTISFGIASYPANGKSVEGLLRCADEALYAAKSFGRDRTVIYSEEVAGVLSQPAANPGDTASNLSTLLTLAEALDIRDSRTAQHAATVGRYAAVMAEEMGLDPGRIERVRLAGVLHDIGKIGVPDAVLFKPGPLDQEEWIEIRKHPEIGARLLSAPGLNDLRAWVLAHHERMDGGGYPMGMREDEIALEAKIIGVADAFEAMLTDRPYRAGMPVEDALEELRRHSGTQFDAQVVNVLIASLAHSEAIVGPAGARSSR